MMKLSSESATPRIWKNVQGQVSSLKSTIWKPRLGFSNSHELSHHSHSSTLHLKDDGTLILRERVKQSIPCKTNVSSYPFGNTTCTLIWKSEDLTQYEARIRWKMIESNGVEAGDLLLNSTSTSHNDSYTQNGVIDKLTLVFTFYRGPNKVLLLFYLPSVICLAISWFSILLGPMAITRSLLNIGAFICSMTVYMANWAGLPETNGITSIDIWRIFSLLFILVVIIELVIVSLMASLGRSRKFRRGSSKRKGKYEIEPVYEELNDLRQRQARQTCGCCRLSALLLDIFSFIFMGTVFAAFCVANYFEMDLIVSYLNNVDITKLF
ncbi:unnamed protein product [Caenorhabditis bovis]|uniref:Neurotransmitter-gated ion-channel ligand-binding domain-containing protein n=1 Tax=Caenorhabditis bovis TaxID=2654633 RepID=A0A8S1FEQ2_9PELO|nr:unnamed protein product [Caenorhabditis bovis]